MVELEKFPFAWPTINPNRPGILKPTITWYEERHAKSVFGITKLPMEIPLNWMGCTNELIHLLNGIRKEKDLPIDRKMNIIINGVSTTQWYAFYVESVYIQEQCLLNKFVFRKGIINGEYDLIEYQGMTDDGNYLEKLKENIVKVNIKFIAPGMPKKHYIKAWVNIKTL